MDSPRPKINKKPRQQTSLSELKKHHSPVLSRQHNRNQVKHQSDNNQSSFYQQRQRIYNVHDRVIYQALKSNDYQTAIPLLLEIQKKIHDMQYGSSKKTQFYHLSVIYHNMTFAYKKKNDSDIYKCSKLMEKAINNMEFAQAYAHDRQENISFGIQIIKLMLKQGVLLSEITKHEQSVIYAEKALQKITDCFRLLQAICHQAMQRDSDSLSSTKETNMAYSHVNFQRIVIQQANSILAQLTNLPTSYKLVSQGKKHFQAIIKNIYFWRNNEKNNEKFLRKQLMINPKDLNSPRNLLGVQKSYSWIQDFTIGKVVAIRPKKIDKQFNFDKYYLLSQPKLLQLILYAASCYFSIATETRFQDQLNSESQLLTIDKKYNKLSHDQTILKCKILHLKAIELAGHYIPYESIFMEHLISSFNKHYKSVLDQITEDIAEQSTMKSILLPNSNKQIKNGKKSDQRGVARQTQIAQFDHYADIGHRDRSSSGDDYGLKPILKKKKKTRSRTNSNEQQDRSIVRKKRSISNKKSNK